MKKALLTSLAMLLSIEAHATPLEMDAGWFFAMFILLFAFLLVPPIYAVVKLKKAPGILRVALGAAVAFAVWYFLAAEHNDRGPSFRIPMLSNFLVHLAYAVLISRLPIVAYREFKEFSGRTALVALVTAFALVFVSFNFLLTDILFSYKSGAPVVEEIGKDLTVEQQGFFTPSKGDWTELHFWKRNKDGTRTKWGKVKAEGYYLTCAFAVRSSDTAGHKRLEIGRDLIPAESRDPPTRFLDTLLDSNKNFDITISVPKTGFKTWPNAARLYYSGDSLNEQH